MFTKWCDKLTKRTRYIAFFWFVFVLIALVSAVADITKFMDLPPQFIGHADQANTAVLARNIAEGKGAVVDMVWLLTNGGIAGNEIPVPESYWSIYVGAVVAFFFMLFSANLTTMLIPAVLMKVGIAAIASGVTLRISKSGFAALAVAVPLLYHPAMTDAVNGLSDIYLTFFMLSAAVVLIVAILRDSLWLFFLAGLLIGVAAGVKPSGFILVGLLIGYLVFSGSAIRSSGRVLIALMGIFLGLFPLLHHNYQAFGSVVSPASSLVREAAEIRRATFDHNMGFYNPEPFLEAENTVAVRQSSLEAAQEKLRWFYAAQKMEGLVPFILYPFILAALLTTLFSIRSFFFYKGAGFERLFAYISVQMLIAGLVLACVVHWEARYWNFLIPFLLIMSVLFISKLTERNAIFATLYGVIIIGALWSFVEDLENFKSSPIPPAYAKAASLLPQDAIVFTGDPWEFSFHTRLRSVALPYTSNDSAVLSLSERYGVGYIVIINKTLRHPKYRAVLNGELPEYLEPFFSNNFLSIVKFKSRY